ncbi:MAG TPA: hypothetical protein VGI56_14710 [Galbitalea sp.]
MPAGWGRSDFATTGVKQPLVPEVLERPGVEHPRHHHPHHPGQLHHNNGWEISRDNTSNYWLSKPANTDPDQTPILLKQSRAMHDLKRERARDANSDGT